MCINYIKTHKQRQKNLKKMDDKRGGKKDGYNAKLILEQLK